MTDVRFLSVDNVVRLHERTIQTEGGSTGIRDRALLDSAVSAPRQSFGGEYLHPTLASMAAAYLFHLVKNHPFVDGNKRAGALSCLLFLYKNGQPLPEPEELERMTVGIADSSISKNDTMAWLSACCEPAAHS